MKLNRTRELLLACAILPLAALSAESPIEPLWEIKLRLDGGKTPIFADKIEKLVGKGVQARAITSNTVLRVAGFKNDDTPEQDWIAEFRGVQGLEKILPADKLGAKYAAWSGGSDVLLMAGPATNKGQAIQEMVVLEDTDFLSGWIDFDELEDAEIESKLLKLPEKLSFTFAGTDELMTVILRPRFDSVATAAAVPAWLAKFSDLLRKVKVDLPNPPTICKVEGTTVTLRMDFKGEDLNQLCDALKKVIAQQREENSSDQGH